MMKAQILATIRSKVKAQKVRRRMWSVRGIGTMQEHFTVGDRGCPREKQGQGTRGAGTRVSSKFPISDSVRGFAEAPNQHYNRKTRAPYPEPRVPSSEHATR